jgi:hypothetical protein
MKSTKMSVLSVILLFVSVSAFGQASSGGGGGGGGGGTATTPVAAVSTPQSVNLPSTLPIASQEVLIANAKRLVARVTVNIWSRGFVYGAPGTVTYFEKEYIPSVAGQPDFSELLAVVGLAQFSFEMRNPHDPIEVRVTFRDRGGRDLFQGSQQFKLVKKLDGSYAPPAPEIKVRVWPSGDLPLDVPGADWVELAMLNEQGETAETRTLDRDQRTGNFLFPLWLAGQRNVLVTAVANREDGTTVKAVYSSQTGARQPTSTHAARAAATLENVIVVNRDSTVVSVTRMDEQVARAFNNGVSPLVQVSFTKTQALTFYAEHPSDGTARGFWVRRGDQSLWYYYTLVPAKPTVIELGAGVYDIIIDWPTLGKRDQSFGGGKGGGGDKG